MKNPAPRGAEDDDAGHVQRPTGKSVFADLRLAHGVEEELEIPQRPRRRGEQIVGEHGNFQIGGRSGHQLRQSGPQGLGAGGG